MPSLAMAASGAAEPVLTVEPDGATYYDLTVRCDGLIASMSAYGVSIRTLRQWHAVLDNAIAAVEINARLAAAGPICPLHGQPLEVVARVCTDCGHVLPEGVTACPLCVTPPAGVKGLTPEEAQAAYDSAEAVPISPERIKEIVDYATGSNGKPPADPVALALEHALASADSREEQAHDERMFDRSPFSTPAVQRSGRCDPA